MFLVDFDFELPMMKKGGVRKQKPVMGVPAIIRQGSFSQNPSNSLGPNGENTVGKRVLAGNRDQNENFDNEQQLIAFGEATIEDVGPGTQRNPRTVTFELSQEGTASTANSPPLLI